MKNITRVWIGDPYEGGHFNGTAFFIDEHILITAKHVVTNREGAQYKNIFLSNTPDGGITPVVSIELCKRDIAILKVKKAFDMVEEDIVFSDELKEGKDVNIVGFYDKNSSQKSYINRVSGYQNDEHTYELQNHLTHGLSGSPVLLDGEIVGITKAINNSKNLTYVIPIEEACIELEISHKYEEVIMVKGRENKSKIESLTEFILPVIMPGITILIIFYLLTLWLFSSEFFANNYYFYIFISFLLAKFYLYIGKRKRT